MWLKNVTVEGVGGSALLECLGAALSGFSGTLLLVVPALTALLARQLRGLHLRLIARVGHGHSSTWWCVSESLWAGLEPFASRAVSGPEGTVLLPCRRVRPARSRALANRHLSALTRFLACSPPPSLPGGGGSVPEMEGVEEERVGEALFEKASEYLDLCRSDFSVEKAQQAGRLGAELISSAGTVEKAVHVLNTARVQKLGDHLAGAKQSALKGISPLHQEYLQACAQDGVPSRREKPLVREEAKNHGSVYGYEEELLQKAWKDAAYGAALFVDPEVGKVSQLLDQAGVAESPLGRAPKQNPDRTISAEGRPINDMRRQNDAGSEFKFNHPPPQPRHHAVARQSLWWRARHPGVPQKCAKRDVPRAFKWHFLRARDVPEFAVKLAGAHYSQPGHALWLGRFTGRICSLERSSPSASWVVPTCGPEVQRCGRNG